MSPTPESTLPVLLVDDEPQLLRSASLLLRSAGIGEVITLEDSRKVLPMLDSRDIGVVVLDLTMPFLSGQTLLRHAVERHPQVPVIILTAANELVTAVDCMQSGATDYIVKPVEKNRLVSSVMRALEIRGLREEVVALKDHLLGNTPGHDEAFAEIVTQSDSMRSIFRYIEAIAPSPQPVLITGETGTGKELIASAIHGLSGRTGELVAVNAAGLDDQVFTDTLFGHTRGAFTGAERVRAGLIVQAEHGTVFLDEIGDLPESSQIKLLRLLQEHKFYPLGSDQARHTDARVVVATHRSVDELLDRGLMRRDLYYRLRTHHLHIPPLRERRDDLPLLVQHFLEKAALALSKRVPTPPRELTGLLNTYGFAGNVRELEGMIFDAVAQHRGGVLSLSSFKRFIGAQVDDAGSGSDEPLLANLGDVFTDRLPTLKEAEEWLIAEALQRADGNQGIAAGMLGLTRQALNKRLVRRRKSGP